MSIQAMRERKAALSVELQNLFKATEGKSFTPENTATYDAKMAEIDAINADIARVEKFLNATADSDNQLAIDNVADKFAHQNKNKLSAEIINIHQKWIRNGADSVTAEEWAKLRVQNAQSVGTGSAGGYTVPTEVVPNVIEALKAYGGMRDVATIITTDSGAPMNYPQSDGTAELGELVGENSAAASLDVSFAYVQLATYKYSSKSFAVPFELLQDSAVDINALINTRAVTRIGRITNNHFTTGTGSGQPNGIVTAASAGKTGTTGQTSTVIFDDLIDLVHSVDPAYRALGRCRFMMNDASLKVIRKLKDSNNRPIFLPGYEGLGGKMGDTLLGYPIQINQSVATMAANAKSILFGDFSFYIIRDVMGATMFRFADSAYVSNGQIGFLMWMRCGGNFTDIGGAVKYYVNSAT